MVDSSAASPPAPQHLTSCPLGSGGLEPEEAEASQAPWLGAGQHPTGLSTTGDHAAR